MIPQQSEFSKYLGEIRFVINIGFIGQPFLWQQLRRRRLVSAGWLGLTLPRLGNKTCPL